MPTPKQRGISGSKVRKSAEIWLSQIVEHWSLHDQGSTLGQPFDCIFLLSIWREKSRPCVFTCEMDIASLLESIDHAMTVPDVAKLLGFSRSALYEMVPSAAFPTTDSVPASASTHRSWQTGGGRAS